MEMDDVATPRPHPLDETSRRSDDVGLGVRSADVAADLRSEAIIWASLATDAVALGTAMAVVYVELQLTLRLPGMVATWLTTAATGHPWHSQPRGAETAATVTAAVAAALAMWLTALTATTPLCTAIGVVAGVKMGLLLAAWRTAGWRHPATGAAAALQQRLAAVCAAEAAAAVALLFTAGSWSMGPEPRVAVAAICAFALQAAVAIGVARTVTLPAAPMGEKSWVSGVLPPAGTAFDPDGPVWTWAAARPTAVRTSVRVTAELAVGTATAAVAVAGIATTTHYLPPAAPGAVVAFAALVPVLVVAAMFIGVWRRWARSFDWAAWCNGGGTRGDVATEAAPLAGVFESPSRQP